MSKAAAAPARVGVNSLPPHTKERRGGSVGELVHSKPANGAIPIRGGFLLLLAVVGGLSIHHSLLLGVGVCLLTLPFTVRALNRSDLAVVSAILLWLIAQCASDLVHHSGLQLSDNLVFAISFGAGYIALRATLKDRPSLTLPTLMSVAVAEAVYQVLYGDAAAGFWKFGIGPACSLFVIAGLGVWGAKPLMFVAAFLGLAALSAAQGDRSLALLLVLALALSGVLRGSRRMPATAQKVGALRQVTVAAVGFVALYELLLYGAVHGMLGARSQAEVMRISSSQSDAVLTERPEGLQDLYVVAHHPIFGLGARPSLTTQEFNGSLSFVHSLGYPLNVNSERYLQGPNGEGLATHSQALDTAVAAGAFALLFWIVLWKRLLATVARRSLVSRQLRPALMLLAVICFWDSLFSPLVPGQLLTISAALAVFSSLPSRNNPSQLTTVTS